MDLNHLPLHRRPVHREDVDNLIPKTQRVTPGHVLLAAGYPKVRMASNHLQPVWEEGTS